MDKIYWQSPTKNIGDELNADFFDKALKLDVSRFKPGEALLGIGSILSFDTTQYKKVHVLGSGSGGPTLNIRNIGDYRFWFVRGPLTAKLLGIDKDLAISDPAILVPEVYGLDFPRKSTHKAVFIPHYFSDLHGGWDQACEHAGIKYTPPTASLERICEDIRASELVITESLHGAIFADTCRTPWILVRTPQVAKFPFKWHDWTASIGMRYEPLDIPWLSTLPLSRAKLAGNSLKVALRKFNLGPDRWGDKVTFISSDKDIASNGKLLKSIAESVEPKLTSDDLLQTLKARMMQRFDEFGAYLRG